MCSARVQYESIQELLKVQSLVVLGGVSTCTCFLHVTYRNYPEFSRTEFHYLFVIIISKFWFFPFYCLNPLC